MVTQRDTANRQDIAQADPGALATAGMGAADMASFGLGPQIARKLVPGASVIQQAGKQQHPTAHLTGEIAGLLGPAGIELGLAKAGLLAPSAARVAVNAIKGRAARAAAKLALNAVEGAAYAGAQAAGRTEGGIAPRLKAAGKAAPYGAAAGAVLPIAFSAGQTAIDRLAVRPAKAVGRAVGETLDRLAGKSVPKSVPLNFDLLPPSQSRPPVSLSPSPKVAPDPLKVPTFQRRGLLTPDAVPTAKPGHPVFYGEGSPTTSAEVRGGEPLYPSANPEVQAALRSAPYEKLQAALRTPETPTPVKNLILLEIQRRGIVGPGLLAPR